MSTFVATERDRDGLNYLAWECGKRKRHEWAHVRCFSREEAWWIKRGLRRQGHTRVYVTWLRFHPPPTG